MTAHSTSSDKRDDSRKTRRIKTQYITPIITKWQVEVFGIFIKYEIRSYRSAKGKNECEIQQLEIAEMDRGNTSIAFVFFGLLFIVKWENIRNIC